MTLGLPLASVGLYAWALISDHQAGTSQLVFHPRLDERERQRLIALFSEEAQGTAGNFKLLGKIPTEHQRIRLSAGDPPHPGLHPGRRLLPGEL